MGDQPLEQRPQQSRPAGVVRQDIRVAILEAHRLMRDSMAELLERSGFRVVATAGEPELFLQRIGGANPQVVILDLALELPSGSGPTGGLSVLRELRQYHPDVRPIVFSASREQAAIDSCLQEGAWAFLDKVGTGHDTLVQTVDAICSGERMVSQPFLQRSLRPLDEQSSGTGSSLMSALTMREREVLAYVAAGADNLKIASHLKISERTVKAHVSSLYKKLGSENRAQLALLARQLGIRPAPNV